MGVLIVVKFGLAFTFIVALAFGMSASDASAEQTGWSFVGTWKMNVRCGDYKMINTVRISDADSSVIDGTTNVDDGFGQIISGKFDGKNVKFVLAYVQNGIKYTEVWKGSLSRGGNYFKGAFSSTRGNTCQYSGSRE